MFERFTDSARNVVVLAQEEARALNHAHIGTEHLLLAILRAPDTIAGRALASFGVSLQAARQQVEVVVGRGQRAPEGHIPFTPRGKKVLELALREALQLHDNHIGAEHILLGVIREGTGAAVGVLEHLGVQLDDVRQRVMELVAGPRDDPEPENDPEFLSRFARVQFHTAFAESVSTAMARHEFGDEPRCSRCSSAVGDNLRVHTLTVPHDSADVPPEHVTLLWCGVCGTVLAAMPAN